MWFNVHAFPFGECDSRRVLPRPAIDALIAATAKVDNLVLVTRNVDDMKYMGVKIYDPFAD